MRKPIPYVGLIDIRFSDLDPYNHVNSKHHIDLVITQRLNFMSEHCGMTIDQVTAKGIGLYITRSTIQYRRAIPGLQKVMIKSHVAQVKARRVLVIPFEIRNQTEEILFSTGELEIAIVNLKTQEPSTMEPWMEDLLFEK